MIDLISRSELLKHCHRVTEYDEAGFSMEYNAVSVEDIKNAPIAYDVDSVVKELEKEKEIAFLTLANTGNKIKDIVYDEVMVYLNTAIEIVKKVVGEINE